MQIADAANPANQPDPTQLFNATYLYQSWQKLINDLENPIAVAGGGSVFSYAPCYVNLAPAGELY